MLAGNSRRSAKATLTAGLKWAPDIGAERENEHRQNSAGRKRIAEKRKRAVTAGEFCGHNAGPDDARKQEGRTQALGNAALRQR